MTLNELIEVLESIRAERGGALPVYRFDFEYPQEEIDLVHYRPAEPVCPGVRVDPYPERLVIE